jgi:hypothetical protein
MDVNWQDVWNLREVNAEVPEVPGSESGKFYRPVGIVEELLPAMISPVS